MPCVRPTQPVHQKCYSHSLWRRAARMPQWPLLHPLFPLHHGVTFPPCSRCVAPISTVALSQGKSEPQGNAIKAPWPFSRCNSDWAARPEVPCATPGDCASPGLSPTPTVRRADYPVGSGWNYASRDFHPSLLLLVHVGWGKLNLFVVKLSNALAVPG